MNKATKVILAAMGRADWKEPRLEMKPFTGRGWGVLMCLQAGELRVYVKAEALMRVVWVLTTKSGTCPCP